MRHRRAHLFAIVVAGFALAVTGCVMGGQSTQRVTWDLRHSHTKADVGWKDSLDSTQIDQPLDLTILLPGGRTLNAHVAKVGFDANGNSLQTIYLFYPATTIDNGYSQTQKIAQAWDLDTRGVEEWHQEVQQGRQQGLADWEQHFYVNMNGKPLSPDGPTPAAEIINSMNESKPFQLSLKLQWL